MSDTQNPIARDELIKVIREIDLAYDENTSPRDYRERMADAMLALFDHPEGTEDLHRKLAEQAATIATVEQYAEDRAWKGQHNNRVVGSNRIASDLLAILDRTEGTR